jgi:hypothetical protein
MSGWLTAHVASLSYLSERKLATPWYLVLVRYTCNVLNWFKSFKRLFARITIVQTAAQGRSKRAFHSGILAIAIWAMRIFQQLHCKAATVSFWRCKPVFFNSFMTFWSNKICSPSGFKTSLYSDIA